MLEYDCLVVVVVVVAVVVEVVDVLEVVDASYFVVVALVVHRNLCTYPYCGDFGVLPKKLLSNQIRTINYQF